MIRTGLLLGTALLLFTSSGCATLANGRLQTIDVSSNPEEADVRVDCGLQVTMKTPARVPILRKADPCTLEVRLDGYQPQRIALHRGYSRWYWVNLAMAGTIPLAIFGETFNDNTSAAAVGLFGIGGLFIDRLTGAAFDHEMDRILVKLEPEHRSGTVTATRRDCE